ncbi:MAG: prephenate dehydrogenase [Bryobacteraceae bacterium]
MKTVAIAGVGLIGGSFGLALRAAGFEGRIVGVSSAGTIAKAVARGAIDEGVSLEQAAAEADLVLLAQPIAVILETLPKLAGKVRPGALVTDAGSTKRRIVECGTRALGSAFLGGHPMAGKESRGVEAAEAELYRGRPWLVTPRGAEELEKPQAREFLTWLERIGAQVRVCSAEEHDRRVARSSHLPQMLATTLARGLGARADRAAVAGAAGPGLTDMTRLALSAWPIWKDILATNGDCIAEALGEFQEELGTTQRLLEAGELEEAFQQGAEFAAEVRRTSAG